MGVENSGRRPKPRALTILRGKKPANPAEPIPPAGAVVKPAGLSGEASAVWDELAPICLHMGTLTVADVRPFSKLCELEVTLALAYRWKYQPKKQAEGIKLEKEFTTTIRHYYALFGLDPVSRARIQVAAKPPESKWA